MSPKISVVMPVYNGMPFIGKALQSVFDQEYPAHEIIVINDGSKDGTQAFLDGLKGRIITRTIPNGGVSNARNEGIRMATGDYIAFLDSDDAWFKTKLKVIAGYIEKYPDAGLFSSNYVERLSDLGNRLRAHSTLISRPERLNYNAPLKIHPLELLLVHNAGITPSAVVVKKAVAERAGLFDPACKIVEDLDFYLRVALHTDFVLVRDILLYKRNHDANMSFNKLRLYLGRKEVVERFFNSQNQFTGQARFTEYVRRSMAHSCYRVGNFYFETKDVPKAFASYAEALRRWPSIENLLRYGWTVLKKSARLASADKLSRKNLIKNS